MTGARSLDGPLAATNGFLAIYLGYATVLLATLLSVSITPVGPLRAFLGALPGTALLAVVAAVVRVKSGRGDGWRTDSRSALLTYGAAFAVVPAFVAGYALWAYLFPGWIAGTAGPRVSRLPVVALVQAAVLAVVLGVFGRPLVPVWADSDTPPAVLELHLTNWWRFAQVTATAFVAFGIGIAASNLVRGSPGGPVLETLTLTTSVGIFGLVAYTLVKLYSVGEAVRSAHDTDRRDREE